MQDFKVIIYTTCYCGYCHAAKRLLADKGIAFEEVDVTANLGKRKWLRKQTGSRTVPQIFWDGKSIGGYTDLCACLPALLGESPCLLP